MINLKSIRTLPPKINTEDAIQLLNYVKDELLKDKNRCLTAAGKVTNLILTYEGVKSGTRH